MGLIQAIKNLVNPDRMTEQARVQMIQTYSPNYLSFSGVYPPGCPVAGKNGTEASENGKRRKCKNKSGSMDTDSTETPESLYVGAVVYRENGYSADVE